uniref:CHASE2 domain-containing protein n=1 Tax=Candidatus Kentrum sp. SD TaxID=2126332 RepID=A0A450YN52_9GAMM|nr:MAG: hypothetical protein BECKSD772F_GA0070984_102210 [Candidatus Kentron sp. SD]VFK42984.1 MAG: hypothetical protein BECKSD772E_GA0070983_102110 [Candidatus Kentron sp. SD]
MRRTFFHGVLVVALACGVAFGLNWQKTGFSVFGYYVPWRFLAGRRVELSHTAIVDVGDESLSLFPTRPLVFWGPHFARAIRVLDTVGAKLIGLDFLFSVSAEKWIAKFTGDRQRCRVPVLNLLMRMTFCSRRLTEVEQFP